MKPYISFKHYIKEQVENLHIVVLTEYLSGDDKVGGKSSTITRIEEECKKQGVKCDVIFIKHSYFINEEFDAKNKTIKIGFVHPDKEKETIINISSTDTVVICRKSVTETEKGLFFIDTLENAGIFVINSKQCSLICNNKLTSTQITSQQGVRNPKTAILSNTTRDMIEKIMINFNDNKYPVILKTIEGEHGVGVMKIDSFDSLFGVLQTLWDKKVQVLIQEMIESSGDIRVIVIDNQIIAAMKRNKADKDFRSNGAQGAEVEKIKINKEIETMALTANKAVGGYWTGSDIILDKNKVPYLLEINASAGTEKVEKISGVNVVGYLIKHLKNRSNWKLNTVQSGYVEKLNIYDKNKLIYSCDVKLDSGNGITPSLHADNIKIKDDTVSFELDGKKFNKPIKNTYKVHIGKQDEVTEKRVSVMFDTLQIGNRKIYDVEVQITSRKGTIKELEPCLIGRDTINKFGFVVNVGEKYLLKKA